MKKQSFLKRWFNSIEHVDWVRMRYVLGIVAILWFGLAEIIPPVLFRYVVVVLGTLQAAVTFAMRGGKYVETRTDIPQDVLDLTAKPQLPLQPQPQPPTTPRD